MQFSEALPLLTGKMPAYAHEIRDLPGGRSQWAYVPWREILEFIESVCPGEWQISFTDPLFIASDDKEYCCIRCTLTICGVARQAPGSAPAVLLSNDGKDMSRGDPIERAASDAVRSAAEMFGIGKYLHQQRDLQWQRLLFDWIRKGKAKHAERARNGGSSQQSA
ncbi:MAG TPA: hypothetical protein V6D06_05195 [Trichocoleus sp.]